MSKRGEKIKKVLVVIASYSAFKPPLEKALKTLNIQVTFFDNRSTILFEKFLFAIALLYSPLYQFATNNINKRLIRKVNRLKPDLVLVSKGENISGTTVKKISAKVTIVNWFTDLFSDYKRIEEWLSAYTLFFTQDRSDVNSYRKKGYSRLYCLPYAGSLIKSQPDNRSHDIVFIGSFSKQRESLFKTLDPLEIEIWGDKKWSTSKLKKRYMGKWLSHQEIEQVLKNSKIVVNHHQNRVLNLRVYEATSAGALLITDYSPDLRYMYKVGKEVILYKNPNDLSKKVKYYLERDSLRKNIALAGYIRAKNDHNYVNRLQTMFSIVDKNVFFNHKD